MQLLRRTIAVIAIATILRRYGFKLALWSIPVHPNSFELHMKVNIQIATSMLHVQTRAIGSNSSKYSQIVVAVVVVAAVLVVWNLMIRQCSGHVFASQMVCV